MKRGRLVASSMNPSNDAFTSFSSFFFFSVTQSWNQTIDGLSFISFEKHGYQFFAVSISFHYIKAVENMKNLINNWLIQGIKYNELISFDAWFSVQAKCAKHKLQNYSNLKCSQTHSSISICRPFVHSHIQFNKVSICFYDWRGRYFCSQAVKHV